MKLYEVTDPTRENLLVRQSGKRDLSAEEIAYVLSSIYNVSVPDAELARYVAPFNRLLQEINPTAPDRSDRVRVAWKKLATELAHPVKRNR